MPVASDSAGDRTDLRGSRLWESVLQVQKRIKRAQITRHPKEVRLRLIQKMIRVQAQRDFGRVMENGH
jgi:hypothetical protein